MGAVDLDMPVLIVDDYQTMLRTLGNLMRKLGFANIDEASDGFQALEKLHSRAYGLVISDWNMQPMSGLELVRQMRSDARLDQVLVVMVSAEDGEGAIAAAKQAGVSEYIVKPFCAATLKNKLAPILGRF